MSKTGYIEPGSYDENTPITKAQAKVELGRRIKQLLAEKGWTQKELSDRAKHPGDPDHIVGPDSICNYIAGKVYPNRKNLICMANAFGITVEDLAPWEKTRGIEDDPLPEFQVRSVVGHPDRVFLQMNTVVDADCALEMQIAWRAFRKRRDAEAEAPKKKRGK